MKTHVRDPNHFRTDEEIDLRPQPNNDLDSIEFINIYTKGKTPLGKMLAHFTHMPFRHPQYGGTFYTIEGFWHWYKSSDRPDRLRYLNGPKARDMGKNIPCEWRDDFKEAIFIATWCKIEQNPELKDMFLKSSLPFEHYFLDGPKGAKVPVRPAASLWLCKMMERIRTMMWNGERPEILDKLDPRPAPVTTH